ncbi:dihydrofolate reductase family protein [Amycolatopsis sp. WQ 127309]|uniref:dihydrofolate reductase family protein n=1 Tax=Amycolatopsis sp. WQ 127309 TaxID=2932773 RepID=UPI001FF532AE|nr:dihydrofolate reductase family protein [Amycolatopsis sp. WQ 127309]UOZ06315.1 dihydrofolate reductase family protein [Amycolatopsis sp. WQ 127309]
MAKLLCHITMSLDGFVAGPADDMSWLAGQATGPNPVVERLLGEIGAVLLGHRTYAPATSAEGEVYGGRWQGPKFVLTRDDPATAQPGFTFVEDLGAAVTTASKAAGDGYVALLGPTLARRCLDAGLLDEVLVHVVPVLLGDGVRLFDHPGGTQVRLDPIELSHAGRISTVWCRVA